MRKSLNPKKMKVASKIAETADNASLDDPPEILLAKLFEDGDNLIIEAVAEVISAKSSEATENLSPDLNNQSLKQVESVVPEEPETIANSKADSVVPAEPKTTANSKDELPKELENIDHSDSVTDTRSLSAYKTLEIGTVHLRLNIPGLFDVLIPVPRDPKVSVKKWSLAFYQEFRDKYWIKVPCGNYRCLICGRQYFVRDCLLTHLNRHMGFKIARCLICSRSLVVARNHAKICKKL